MYLFAECVAELCFYMIYNTFLYSVEMELSYFF